jgi:uncharacterized membrane protein
LRALFQRHGKPPKEAAELTTSLVASADDAKTEALEDAVAAPTGTTRGRTELRAEIALDAGAASNYYLNKLGYSATVVAGI